jgi:hypothetical protein
MGHNPPNPDHPRSGLKWSPALLAWVACVERYGFLLDMGEACDWARRAMAQGFPPVTGLRAYERRPMWQRLVY